MGQILYVTGGARSGKSTFAEKLARQYGSVAYVATATVTDEEMRLRVQKHRQSRPSGWRTVEAYSDLGPVLAALEESAALVECLTTMVTNLMFDLPLDHSAMTSADAVAMESYVMAQVDGLLVGAKASQGDVILVSNEVGMGLVPEYALSRAFRDIAGRVNQKAAAAADRAWLVVSGIPVSLK